MLLVPVCLMMPDPQPAEPEAAWGLLWAVPQGSRDWGLCGAAPSWSKWPDSPRRQPKKSSDTISAMLGMALDFFIFSSFFVIKQGRNLEMVKDVYQVLKMKWVSILRLSMDSISQERRNFPGVEIGFIIKL